MCGQVVTTGLPTTRDWLLDFGDEVASLNRRLFHSLACLVGNPTTYVLDWAEGRRARHVSPLRLYVLGASFWGVLISLLVVLGAAEGGFLAEGAAALSGESLPPWAFAVIAPAMFVLLPITLANWNRLFTGRSKYPYSAHLVVSLAGHALLFLFAPLLMMVFVIAGALTGVLLGYGFFAALGIGMWLFLMRVSRGVFAQSRTSAAWRAVAALLGHGATVIALLVAWVLFVT